MLTFVVPQITGMFESMDQELPAITVFVVSLGVVLYMLRALIDDLDEDILKHIKKETLLVPFFIIDNKFNLFLINLLLRNNNSYKKIIFFYCFEK